MNSAIDGSILGGAMGAIMASRSAFELGAAGGGARFIGLSAVRSALSFAGFLASYNGGTCALESARGKRDVWNPFMVGGFIGVGGALPGWMTPLPHAPYLYRNNKALVGAGLSSALLCSFFYFISSGGSREPAPADLPSPSSATTPGASTAGQYRPAMPQPTMPQPVMPQPVMPQPNADMSAAWPSADPDMSEWQQQQDQMMHGIGKEDLVDKWK